MKEKLSFVLTNTHSDLESLVKTVGCFEDVEKVFGIEFAAGIENTEQGEKIIFGGDYLFTAEEDAFLEKYDGMVVTEYFRDKDTKKIYNLHESGCRLDIMYDEDYRHNGNEEFSNPKIITKGYAYSKNKLRM